MLLKKKPPVEQTLLEKQLESILSQMDSYDADSPEYAKMADQYVKLSGTTPPSKEDRIHKDALVAAAAPLIGIVIIVILEVTGRAMTSKGLPFAKFK